MAAIVVTFTKLKKLEVSILYVPNSNATKTVCEFMKSSEEACACGKLVILIPVAKLNMYGRATISLHIPIRNHRN